MTVSNFFRSPGSANLCCGAKRKCLFNFIGSIFSMFFSMIFWNRIKSVDPVRTR